jgi:magnesium transporter
MIRILFASPKSGLQFDLPVEQLPRALKEEHSLLWVDFDGEPDANCEPILREVFGFHPLAVDDALMETHAPKVDDWGEYIYIVLNALQVDNSDSFTSLRAHELDVFLGENYVVTHHDEPVNGLEQVWEACKRDERHTKNGADHLLYKIIDYIVAAYMPIVEDFDRAIDDMEDRIFEKPDGRTVEGLFALKRALLTMRRVITPQREVLNKLARDDYRVIDRGDRIFFRDVYDHLVRMHDLNESMRDLVGGALDMYLSVINNRMNEVMKTLTIITTIFMPISFIAGFFGMNFFGPVLSSTIWTGKVVLGISLSVMLILPVSMLLWMHRRMWV